MSYDYRKSAAFLKRVHQILIIFERIESALIKSKKHFFNSEHSGVIFGFIC